MKLQIGYNVFSIILILVTFVFLLITTISTPIFDIFHVGITPNTTYGIFGVCLWENSVSTCSKAMYPVKLSEVDPDITWLLPNTTRDNLAKTFIVAPIALGFSFITFVILVVSLFTSKKVVLMALVVNALCFIATTLITIIVVLVFHPYVAWTGWLMIGACIGSLISLIFLILQLTLTKKTHPDDISLSEFIDKDSAASGFETPFGPMDNNVTSFGGPVPNHYNDSSSSFSKGFESKGSAVHSYTQFKLSQYNGVVGPQLPANEIRTMSNSSAYYSNPQLANDFTQKQAYNQGSSVSVFDNFDSRSGESVIKHPQTNTPRNYTPNGNPSDEMAGLPYPANSVDAAYPLNHSVFEHHPEVEGHKPFTELNDFDDDVVLQTTLQQAGPVDAGNNSDADSDFTSVSQRAINPRYNDGYQSVPQKYPHVQQFVPHFQQQQSPLIPQTFQQQPPIPQQNNFHQNSFHQNNFQQNNFQQPIPQQFNQSSQHSQHAQPPTQHRGPTVSDTVLNNNPDFGVGGIGPSKRKLQNGFVPGANRVNTKPNSASLMGRGGNGARGGPYGAI